VGKPSALKRQHYTNQNKKCRIEHLQDGPILESTTISRVKIPEDVVSLIRKGGFDYDEHNDPKERPKVERISGSLQSTEELSCHASLVSAVTLFQMYKNQCFDLSFF